MFDPATPLDWGGALLWLIGIAVGAFLISWVLTDLMGVRRGPYIAALAVFTAGLTAGYVLWSGAGAAFWFENWPLGVLGAIFAGGALSMLIFRIPEVDYPGHGLSGRSSAWEGVVYGSAEGLLLSVLPVVAAWQMFYALDWTDGWRAVPAAIGALVASVIVIVVHHLGYPEYRGRAMRSPIIGCTVLSIAYLLTANPIAAMGGHIILHLAMLRRRMELPPHVHESVPTERRVAQPIS